ncbi:MAG: FtsW/RodA/SpoVE family cell cycle protein [Candidatus Marinamargulisbacteria bacterium]
MFTKIAASIDLDWKLILPTLVILIVGYIMIFSTTSFKGLSEFSDPYFFIKRHTVFLIIGMGLFFIATWVPIKYYQAVSIWGYFISIILLLLTLIPGVGISIGGASRWVQLLGVQFQPVEIMKFWWAVSVSVVISNKNHQLTSFKTGMVPVFIVILIPIICLMLQPDLGNAILTLVVGFSLILLSQLPTWVFLLSLISGGAIIGWSIANHSYQMDRIQSFLNPWMDPLGANYHIIQSFTAIGSGGILGFGIGESRLKYFYLPLHYSDFIFSILCEEGGLFLAMIIIFSFAALFFRGVQISLQQKKYSFQQYLAVALTGYLIYQALINICVVSGLFPITGIPLTFISYGGTSLLSSFFCLGVIHKIGRSS